MTIHLSCPICHESYVARGLTDAAESRAANAGPTCCTPEPPAEPDDLGKAPGSAGHLLGCLFWFVGVPVVVWAFLVALIYPHL